MVKEATTNALWSLAPSFGSGLLLTWGAVGDLSERSSGGTDPPMVDLPNGTGGVQVVALTLSVLLLAASTWLIHGQRSPKVRQAAKRITITMLVFGAWIGLLGRVLAARTIGANIGGGLMLLGTLIAAISVASFLSITIIRVSRDRS